MPSVPPIVFRSLVGLFLVAASCFAFQGVPTAHADLLPPDPLEATEGSGTATDTTGPAVADETGSFTGNAENDGLASPEPPSSTPILLRLRSLMGLPLFVFLCWLISSNRKRISWRIVFWGLGLQIAIASLVMSDGLGQLFFNSVDSGVRRLLSFSEAGADFLFQSVEVHQVSVPGEAGFAPEVFVGRISPPVKTFAFWILPTIIFFSSLTTLLYHVGVLQFLVAALARLMQRTMGTSGPETLSAAGNIFVGQTEAPLLIRPYISVMTRSELHAVMTAGFATVAGGVLGAYVGFLSHIPGIAGHLVVASLMSAPAALVVSKLMLPETEDPGDRSEIVAQARGRYSNAVEAAAGGASEGMKLALNVAAMLVAAVALMAMVNWGLGCLPFSPGGEPLSLERILGVAFAPVAFVMGIPAAECTFVGTLLGEKIVLTELIAYLHLGEAMGADIPPISERSAVIASYALCGFANFASVGIQLGGIGGIAPERMKDLADLGIRAMIGGAIATCMTGAVVGVML